MYIKNHTKIINIFMVKIVTNRKEKISVNLSTAKEREKHKRKQNPRQIDFNRKSHRN